jgi:hypothetical protein
MRIAAGAVMMVAIAGAGMMGQTMPTSAPATQPAVMMSYRAEKDVEPTADAESEFWKGIQGVVMERSVLGPAMPGFRAQIRSRWTEKNLYFLFIGHYEKLTVNAKPELAKETPHLWEKDVFEVYVGADFEHTNRYRELQMSPQGEWLDNDIDSTVRRPGFNGEEAWNSGFKVKARVDEKEKVWYGEMQIPIGAIDGRPAKAGNEMRVNFYRQDTPLNVNGQTRGGRVFLAWQPPGVWNPHHPEKFGLLRLVDGG